MKLTANHLRELRRIRDEGRSRSRTTQRAGLSEFVWKLRDGRLIGDSQVSENWYDEMHGAQNVGQRLTDAGRAALEQSKEK